MQVTLTRNEVVQCRTRDLSMVHDEVAIAVGGMGVPPASECGYLTQLKVEQTTRSVVLGSPMCNLDPILDEVVARVGA